MGKYLELCWERRIISNELKQREAELFNKPSDKENQKRVNILRHRYVMIQNEIKLLREEN